MKSFNTKLLKPLIRNPIKPIGPIQFNIVEWDNEDEKEKYTDVKFDDDDYYDPRQYIIRMFGVTEAGESVCCTVENYEPFFYVEIPSGWRMKHLKSLIGTLKGKRYNVKTPKQTYYYKFENTITDYKIIKRKKFYGFTNDEEFTFVKINFKNNDAMRKCSWLFKNSIYVSGKGRVKLNLYESNIEPMLRFMHIRNILSAGWVETVEYEENDVSRCQIDIKCDWKYVNPIEKDTIAPIRQASFDIECNSVNGDMPIPEIDGNYCTQIATAIKDYGSDDFAVKHILTLKQCGNIDGAVVESFDNEKDLLLRWAEFITELDPDVLTGYNIFGFDLNYLMIRAKKAGCYKQFSKLGRLKHRASKIVEKVMESKAYGRNEWKMVPMIGRLQIDLLPYMRREKKYESYKLDYVAEQILGEHKNDVTPKQIFEYFQNGDINLITTLAEYCVKDTLLPQRILDKMCIIPNIFEMAKVTRVPIFYLIVRGQQIKVISQIAYYTKNHGYLIPAVVHKEENLDYEGATVLNAKKGAYLDVFVTGLDFKSLYPTIMIDHNLCYITIVLDPRYDNLPGVKYTEHKVGNEIFRFAHKTKGLLPIILEDLLNARGIAKKDMAAATDPFTKSVMNGRQLALKVSCNSVYGFTGVNEGMLPCKPIAKVTCKIGRGMIDDSQQFAEDKNNFKDIENYDTDVIYGDSVCGYTPVILKDKNGGEIFIKSIDDLTDNYVKYDGIFKNSSSGKECGYVDKYMIWTHKGWSNIKKVIRHAVNKDIYRVQTQYGLVDVTEDHSLINSDNILIKPMDSLGENLLTSFPDDIITSGDEYTVEEAYKIGEKRKEVPNGILNGNEAVMKAFLDGWCIYK